MPLAHNPVCFGAFELDVRAGELRRNGTKVRLQAQPLQVLAMLLEYPGEVVTREELKQRLWSADTFVDFEHGLNAAVKRLRIALGDSAERPRFIETLPRHGYRLLVAIEKPAESPAPLQAIDPSAGRAGASVAGWPLLVIAGLVLILLAAASYMAWRAAHQRALRGGRVMVAVLPLQNLSGDSARQFFVDGITVEMINQFGHIDPQHVGVIASTAVAPYKHTAKKISQIGQELGADYILEGSVREEGRRVRITVQLIAVANQAHVWAESYERDASEVLKTQTEIAQAVAEQIKMTLGARAR